MRWKEKSLLFLMDINNIKNICISVYFIGEKYVNNRVKLITNIFEMDII